MRSTFLDPELDARLAADGYVVVPLLGPEEVERLAAAYQSLGVAPGDPQRACIDTFHCFDSDYKEAVHAEVEAVLAPRVAGLFDRHKSLSYCYIQKWPGETSGFGLHQDISVLDERRYRSVEVWCALTDTNEENGQLWVVPGSHTWAPVQRGIHGCPPPYAGLEERIISRHAIPVPVEAGQAIVFCHSTYHFSFPNRSGRFRLVAATDLIPEEAQHLHYFANDSGTIDEFEIEESFWTENNPFTLRTPPQEARLLGQVDPAEFPRLTEEDLDRFVAEGRAIDHPPVELGTINPDLLWCHRCGTTDDVAGHVDRLVGNITLLCSRCDAAQARMAGVLGDIDPDLLAQLDKDGYAVVPLFDGEDLATAMELYDSLRIAPSTPFYATNQDAPRHEAVRIDGALQALAQPGIDRVMPGYRVFKGVMLSKGPNGDNPVSLHQDWEYVDERYHRGYVVWCPLRGAGSDDGGMHVIPGSHRWLDNHRGAGFPDPWTDVADEIIARASVAVPVPAGHAVVYDNALLHHTPPNRGRHPRPAVAVAIAPPAAAVLHLHSSEEGRAEVFEIPPGSTHFTSEPFGTRPSGEPMRSVEVTDRKVGLAELDEWIPEGSAPPAAPASVAVPAPAGERRRGLLGRLLRR